ncbi:hypothetical protein [Reyranella sp.]|uniref:hypothetical protein n=1 Tax=Reyranella sp. TaxID=1929291 RepID=UPI003D11268E
MKSAKVSVTKKPIGRPPTGVGTQIGMRWQASDLAAIDEWRRLQPELPSRTEAIRRLVELGLAKGGKI